MAHRRSGGAAARHGARRYGRRPRRNGCRVLRTVERATHTAIDNVGGYLLRAVTNEAHNVRRGDERRRRRDVAAIGPTQVVDQPADIDLRRAMVGLSIRQRSILFLVYWEDLTEPATAAALGLSRGTVSRELRRARDRLRKELS